MNETKEQERKKEGSSTPEEIDLIAVFRSVGSFFGRVGDWFRNIIRALVSNILLVAIFIALGMTVGYGAFKVTKPYYTSSMTLILSDIRNEFVENQLTSLIEMVNEDNYAVIAKQLEIDVEEAKQIKKMKFKNLDQERIAEDSILVGSPFKIELMLYDNGLFEVMEPALVNFLENNRYFSKQKLIRQRQVEGLIGKYKSEISSIDSVKASVISPRGPVNGFVYGEPIDPTNLFKEGITMYQEQVKLEGELDRLDNIEIVNGFTPRLNPTGPNLFKFLLIGGFIAFIVGVIVAMNLEAKKKRKLSY